MNENRIPKQLSKGMDCTEDTIYGINSEQQAKINKILTDLEITTRKTQNINFIKIKVDVVYYK